jgi:ATP-dependent HslUV protease subunit HslV
MQADSIAINPATPAYPPDRIVSRMKSETSSRSFEIKARGAYQRARPCYLFWMIPLRRRQMRSTTVLCVRREGKVAIAGDGQVTLGTTVMKTSAAKIRRLYDGKVLVGFAGTSADAFALFSKFEGKLEEFRGNLERASVELARDWRTDKILRQLEALLIVADREISLLISGTGDLISPDEGVLAIGSGGPYALAAAKALLQFTNLPAAEVARESLRIASTIDVYTNDKIRIEEL